MKLLSLYRLIYYARITRAPIMYYRAISPVYHAVPTGNRATPSCVRGFTGMLRVFLVLPRVFLLLLRDFIGLSRDSWFLQCNLVNGCLHFPDFLQKVPHDIFSSYCSDRFRVKLNSIYWIAKMLDSHDFVVVHGCRNNFQFIG